MLCQPFLWNLLKYFQYCINDENYENYENSFLEDDNGNIINYCHLDILLKPQQNNIEECIIKNEWKIDIPDEINSNLEDLFTTTTTTTTHTTTTATPDIPSIITAATLMNTTATPDIPSIITAATLMNTTSIDTDNWDADSWDVVELLK